MNFCHWKDRPPKVTFVQASSTDFSNLKDPIIYRDISNHESDDLFPQSTRAPPRSRHVLVGGGFEPVRSAKSLVFLASDAELPLKGIEEVCLTCRHLLHLCSSCDHHIPDLLRYLCEDIKSFHYGQVRNVKREYLSTKSNDRDEEDHSLRSRTHILLLPFWSYRDR